MYSYATWNSRLGSHLTHTWLYASRNLTRYLRPRPCKSAGFGIWTDHDHPYLKGICRTRGKLGSILTLWSWTCANAKKLLHIQSEYSVYHSDLDSSILLSLFFFSFFSQLRSFFSFFCFIINPLISILTSKIWSYQLSRPTSTPTQ